MSDYPLIDVGYRDPWDPPDPEPEYPPARVEYDDEPPTPWRPSTEETIT